jgi:hypothetical protein
MHKGAQSSQEDRLQSPTGVAGFFPSFIPFCRFGERSDLNAPPSWITIIVYCNSQFEHNSKGINNAI